MRFKKPQKKLEGGSWTSLQQLQVILPKDINASTAQQSVDRAVAMAKGTIVARYMLSVLCVSVCLLYMPALLSRALVELLPWLREPLRPGTCCVCYVCCGDSNAILLVPDHMASRSSWLMQS